jgi:hypothetical protein
LAAHEHEFVCEDCKAQVFSFGGPADETRCMGCNIIHEMQPLTEAQETTLREILGCQLSESDDALREPDASPG